MSDFLQEPPSGRASGLSSWGERLAVLRAAVTPGRVVLAVVGAAVTVFLGVVFLRTPSHPPELVLPKAGDPPPAAATAPAGAGPGAGSVPAVAGGGSGGGAGGGSATTVVGGGVGVVTVHAAGQVSAPGVYSVPAGARVADLVTAAGGLLPEADIDRLNLAARVVDGTRVYIPRKGEAPPPPEAVGGDPGAAAGTAGGAAGGGGPGAAAGPVDLNTATAAQLDTLPGVGPATAAAILTYRTRHGRFKSVTELLEVPGIGPSKLEAIRPLVVVS
ncbi:MAG TPA: helix-hairpin-helix domain-containing protein [Acidimicrobiales bacterium]|nr:helix-hairpin-helix domain-containing protein [Acidimicrobiales bacterium]